MSLGSTTSRNHSLSACYGDNRGTDWPSTTTFRLYVGDPTSGGVEVSGPGYAPVAVANTTAAMGTPSGGAVGPVAVPFPSASAAWGTPDHWANTDGSGNLLDTGPISSPVPIVGGMTVTLNVTITAA